MRDEHPGPDVGDHSHSCKEHSVGRADRGLQGFSHGIFDRRAELCQSEAGFPLTFKDDRDGIIRWRFLILIIVEILKLSAPLTNAASDSKL